MDIGEEDYPYIIEPAEDPVPRETSVPERETPDPEREWEKEIPA